MRALFIAPSPSPVKAALNLNGIQVGGVRLPMVPLSNKEQSALEKVLQASGINATC